MNIEIANRLVNLRKSNNLSQEALAAKLGISRQAVSKWERAEASPDTDNLILLARLYHVSLDELLRTEDEIPIPEEKDAAGEEALAVKTESAGEEAFSTGTESAGEKMFSSIESTAGENYADDDGTEGEGGSGYFIPVSFIITILYLIIGFVYGAWHPAWLLFLLIPIWYSLVSAINSRNAHRFAYPVFVALIYLCCGCFWGLWHPGWIIYLTIPIYYPMVSYISSLKHRHGRYEKDSFYYNGEGGRENEEE